MVIIRQYSHTYFAVVKPENLVKMKKIFSLAIISLLAINAMAKTEDVKKENSAGPAVSSMVQTIQGKVVDKSTGEALAGVSVKVDDSTVVYTDFEGNFTIKLSQAKAKLSVSLISYSPAEVEVGKKVKEVKIELNAIE